MKIEYLCISHICTCTQQDCVTELRSRILALIEMHRGIHARYIYTENRKHRQHHIHTPYLNRLVQSNIMRWMKEVQCIIYGMIVEHIKAFLGIQCWGGLLCPIYHTKHIEYQHCDMGRLVCSYSHRSIKVCFTVNYPISFSFLSVGKKQTWL